MHWPQRTRRHVLVQTMEEAKRVQTLLAGAIGAEESLRDWINVAGSSALHWYQLSEGLCGSDPARHWLPNDVDVFCCNVIGRTDEAFTRYASEAISRIVELGHTIERVTQHRNRYVDDEHEILIVRVKVAGIDTALSFIQRPGHDSVTEVVEAFDIDICKVLYRIHQRANPGSPIQMSANTEDAIRSMQARCKTFHFKGHSPTSFEVDKFANTLVRMQKYARRGFTFLDYPKIVSV